MNGRNQNEMSQEESCLIEESHHIPLPVGPHLYSQLLLVVLLLTGGFLLPVFYQNEKTFSTDSFSVMHYLHIIVWAIVTALTWYVKAEHKRSRILGYHEFYNETRHLHRVTFYILVGGNILLLIISCVTHNYCIGGGLSPCSKEISLTPVNYIQIIFILEVVIATPLLIKHIVEVHRFNQNRSPPDAFKDDSTMRLVRDQLVVGIRGPSYFEKLLEQQADHLMTLKHRNQVLCHQVFTLMNGNGQLSSSSHNIQNSALIEEA